MPLAGCHMGTTGTIFDISHYMLEDGPGIRTNVFFKGCPLRCKWCSNVYGLEKREQLSFEKNRCTGCGKCLNLCPSKAISWDEKSQRATTDFDKCFDCDFECTDVCPSKARKKIGKSVTAREVFREVDKDFAFYVRGGGGVTLSGGEILMQPEFATDILETCQNSGINTAIETSGFGKWENLSEIIDYCDMVFMDCKCMDSTKHKELTGADNGLILENIKKAAEKCNHMAIPLVVRLPLIPELNDDGENIRKTGDFVKGLKGSVLLNVLPYHNYGAVKYEYVGKKYEIDHINVPDKEEIEKIRKILEETGVRFSIGGYDI